MKPTLLVLAAGMGSRYGGLKQLDPVGPAGETLLEYSVYDAMRAGFGKVVFIIRKEFARQFKEQVGSRFAHKIAVDYAFQELDALPKGFQVPEGRIKPWGTGHAVWVARPMVDGPFVVINADDFYGSEAYAAAADFFTGHGRTWPPQFFLAAYPLHTTLSEHGTVSRGVCSVDDDGYLQSVTEHTAIGSLSECGLAADTPVSMNFFGFTPALFEFLEAQLITFLQEHIREPKAEFYLPRAVATMIARKQAKVRVATAGGRWMGVTYADDKAKVQADLLNMIGCGAYPDNLWLA